MSSTSTSYIRHVDQGPFNSYGQPINGSNLAYFPANPGQLTYNLASISNPSYHNHQTLIAHSYPNEHMNYCCGIPYATNSTYLPPNMNGDLKTNFDHENLVGGQNDEINDSGIKSETSSNEQKSTPPPSSNDSQTNFQEEKRRDLNSVRFFNLVFFIHSFNFHL